MNGKKYWGELFAKAPKEVQAAKIQILEGVCGCIVAELEHELSRLITVSVNKITIYSDIILKKNEQLFFPVKEGDLVHLVGFYAPLPALKELSIDPWRKNEIVLEYMQNYT
ncbi:MAG: hypothetical protein SWO11_18715 [Thermodesulfobacteriota bacterium]|nr:hypothetical protein [Thermodesulfobacteriota bacterium]